MYYLFREENSFQSALLQENCELRETDNVQGQISQHILATNVCVVPCFPLLGLTPTRLFMVLSSTLIYTSELILCSTICVPSATRRSIHMYPYFLFAAIHHLKSSPSFSVRHSSSVDRVTVNLVRRSWVRFPPKSKDFFFASCVPCFPLLGLTPSGLLMGLRAL